MQQPRAWAEFPASEETGPEWWWGGSCISSSRLVFLLWCLQKRIWNLPLTELKAPDFTFSKSLAQECVVAYTSALRCDGKYQNLNSNCFKVFTQFHYVSCWYFGTCICSDCQPLSNIINLNKWGENPFHIKKKIKKRALPAVCKTNEINAFWKRLL